MCHAGSDAGTFDGFGFDFDSTMPRVRSMNMLLRSVENPAIENRDSLSQGHAGVEGQFR